MSLLQLANLHKSYKLAGKPLPVLNGISLCFGQSGFAAILGPSGCGKTTMLNVIGGLDRYDSGELAIRGVPTKKYKDADWDAYRNRCIGFVFQSYNLISHQTVLANVEIGMTLSGVSVTQRRKRAREALEAVGLSDQARKKPTQLSGGQMQRVAIARALVNNPDIILADEPTGALDSATSRQVLDILKEVSKTRLVIMVTHNSELAEDYADRIIRMLDGVVVSDKMNKPYTHQQPIPQKNSVSEKIKRTSMSLWAATALSFKNLLTKKGRTIITAIAGSIGIIGVALVLAVGAGMGEFITGSMRGTMSGFPLTVSAGTQRVDFNEMHNTIHEEGMFGQRGRYPEYPENDTLIRYDRTKNTRRHENIFIEEYLQYIVDMEAELPGDVTTVGYTRGVALNMLARGGEKAVYYETASQGGGMMANMMNDTYWQEMPDNESFILSLYDILGEGRLPAAYDEIAIVVDSRNRMDEAFCLKLGIPAGENYTPADFVGKTLMGYVPNDLYYTENQAGLFEPAGADKLDALFENPHAITLRVTAVLRQKPDAQVSYLNAGIIYTTKFSEKAMDSAHKSAIAAAQSEKDFDVLTGLPFSEAEDDTAKKKALLATGADTTPTAIAIYPMSFDSKDRIRDYLDDYNNIREQDDRVVYNDYAEVIMGGFKTLINGITIVLAGFAAISLVVSSIMIGIITYVSVLERTREIGILRAVGARKRDIGRVFNAETLIIGMAAGVIGIATSLLIIMLGNPLLERLSQIERLARLQPLTAIILIAGSMILTLIAGLIPARVAARKHPVEALRSE
ncbi:MAG: ATP-binding cassette domain-containing protein [Clostridia bacterium]|nr:ATP-binding cassette domain-containing protein [Clostridia bacterium]